MKKIVVHLMNWLARPFPHINAVVLCIFASLLFTVNVAVAFHPYITEMFALFHAPKLAILIRVISFTFFSVYCTLGCFCRILIQFFPEDFADGIGRL